MNNSSHFSFSLKCISKLLNIDEKRPENALIQKYSDIEIFESLVDLRQRSD